MSASPRLLISLAAAAAIGAVFASSPSDCHAQYRNDFDEPFPDVADYQWFEPVDIDLNRRPVRFTDGWYFHYEKFVWAVDGERTVVGDPDVVVFSELVFPENNPLAEGAVAGFPSFLDPNGDVPQSVAPYVVQNDIQSAPPNADFGWGDRYELGYVDEDGDGFYLGVIDGNENKTEQVYGFGDVGTGFGSVHVNFSAPTGYFAGWRDYTFPVFELDNGISVGTDDDAVLGNGPTVSGDGADGVVDDILSNGGNIFIIDVNLSGAYEPDQDLVYYDYGDLHTFNMRFNNLGVRNISQIDGVEVMRTHVLSNRHWMQKHQDQHLEIGYGARLFRFQDQFLFDGISDRFGRTFAFTEAENQIVGPQFRVKWAMQKQRYQLSLDGRCLLGYNVGDLSQEYGLMETQTPGALNDSIIAQPSYGTNGKQESTFSPVVEFRADMRYLLTRSVSLTLGYTGTFVDNITRASQVVEYRAPNMGIGQGGKQHTFINGVNFGVEVWR